MARWDVGGDITGYGTHAARPAATAARNGAIYYETDTDRCFQIQNGAWTNIAIGASVAPIAHAASHLGGSDDVETSLDARYAKRLASILSTSDYTVGGAGALNLSSYIGTANEVAVISVSVPTFYAGMRLVIEFEYLMSTAVASGTRSLTFRFKIGAGNIFTVAPTQVQNVPNRASTYTGKATVRAVAASAQNVFGGGNVVTAGGTVFGGATASPSSVATNTAQTIGVFFSIDAANAGDEIVILSGSIVQVP